MSGNVFIMPNGSVSGMIPGLDLPGAAHGAPKAAVIVPGRQSGMEGDRDGIGANTVSPGLIQTNATRALIEDPK
ncbi:uncharacterized protein Z519_04162 [Cladophialophora bantiana CBS 173.52]|uniref:Uncharacterized protein n=1 Tax=Cladophialophora bantiana (strain ATCC 10958 / CBS 173.52 / CDC B-1940 / NIH 8579) TaxID=1442370 RepID=A0A0D2GAH0_CLAB1|nr:uncharacterized protein Z519_04162 [Cladophialophora bantiana CBS 173.52]KIW95577.1 hypothetical protein Z519_04162 [Cladophialophora bantiana CBS 173.52]